MRALIDGELDPFDFVLGEALGMSLGQIGALPNAEVVEWRQFYEWRRTVQEHEAKKAKARRGR